MIYKIFYSVLMGVSPWIASSPLPSVLASHTQVSSQALEQKAGDLYPQKEQEVKETLRQLAHSDEDVLRQFDLFSEVLRQGIAKGSIGEKDAKTVLDALAFSAEKHKLQVKSNANKTPYIIHPIEVAYLVAKVGQVYDKDILIAALLHDVMDDTTATQKEISSLFGKKAAGYVEEMTSRKDLSLKEQKKEQIKAAFHQTPSVAIIKLSDKLSNLGTLSKNPPSSWSRDRIDQYFQWAQSVIENLPDASQPLKKEVKQVIADYWDKQNIQKKS